MNWKLLAERYPGACRMFNAWLTAKDIMRGYSKQLKGGVALSSLPFELVIGILFKFFREQDIVFSTTITLLGGLQVHVHRLGQYGTFKHYFVTHNKIEHSRAWAIGFAGGFRELENRINGVEDPEDSDETILGISIDDLMIGE